MRGRARAHREGRWGRHRRPPQRRRTTTNGDGRGRGAREGHGLDVNPRSVRCDLRCCTARGAVDRNRDGSRRGGACWRVGESRQSSPDLVDIASSPPTRWLKPFGSGDADWVSGQVWRRQVRFSPDSWIRGALPVTSYDKSTSESPRSRVLHRPNATKLPKTKRARFQSHFFVKSRPAGPQCGDLIGPNRSAQKIAGKRSRRWVRRRVRAPERSALRKRP